jgi:hypothetical protein
MEFAKSAAGWPRDDVTTLDRIFYLRILRGEVEMPRTAEQVRALRDREEDKRWLSIRADRPGDAIGHARKWLGMLPPNATVCPDEGWCESCAVEVIVPLARRPTIDRLIRDVVPSIPGARSEGK